MKIFHPFFVALFPILIIFSQNIGKINLEELILPIILILSFSILVYYFLRIFLKNSYKSAMIVTLILIISFSYGHVYILLLDISENGIDIARNLYLIPLFTTVFVLGTYLIIRTKRILNNATTILNVISFVFILVAISNVGITTAEVFNCEECSNQEFFYERKDFSNYFENHEFSLMKGQELPNVYYLILDEYAREDALLEYHNFDNSEFIESLEDKGFHVAKNSFANYPMSVNSISSLMNMNYVNFLKYEIGSEVRNFKPLIGKEYGLYQNNQVIKAFKDMDYKIIIFNTFSLDIYGNPLSDHDVCNRTVNMLDNELVDTLARTSIFGYFVERFAEDELRQVTLCAFDEFSKMGEEFEKPVFVWAHVMLPHPPWLFGPNGEEITPGKPLLVSDNPEFRGSGWVPKNQYIEQLQFANKKTIEVVEKILEKDSSSIIIIQGDHGTAWDIRGEKWQNPSNDDMFQRLRNFDAIYFPDEYKRKLLDDERTLVNTFRTVFNAYYNSNYDILENKLYWSYNAKPYDYKDVSHYILEN